MFSYSALPAGPRYRTQYSPLFSFTNGRKISSAAPPGNLHDLPESARQYWLPPDSQPPLRDILRPFGGGDRTCELSTSSCGTLTSPFEC